MRIPSLSTSFRLFKQGLDRHLLWAYWKDFKETGWEIFWGPTVFGIAFGIYTIWHSPARTWFLVYVLVVVFLTGYYLWRVNHVRLIPQIKLTQLFTVSVPPESPEQKFAQILVEPVAEGIVDHCQGQLLRILKWSPRRGDWEVTLLNETTDLLWSGIDQREITIESGAPRRLNIFVMYKGTWGMYAWDGRKDRIPVNCAPGEIFRLDIRVGKPGFKAEIASLKLTINQEWGKFEIEELVS
jgi:hypothetical protein